jgi:integrase/recombinase XerD
MDSLFDNARIWDADPLVAFEAFVISSEFQLLGKRKPSVENGAAPAAMRASSAKIYILMFGKFLRWLGERNLNLIDVTSEDIMAFLEHGSNSSAANQGLTSKKDLNSSIRIRYLRIFERVFQHLRIHPNPARHAAFNIYKSGNKALRGQDVDKVAMTDAEQTAFMNALPAAPPTSPLGDRAAASSGRGWKRRRDRAMQAMMLGAGLKVSEVISMASDSVGTLDSTGCVPVTVSPASTTGTSRWHQTQLRSFAVAEVLAWRNERAALKIPGILLFPATLDGGTLDKATVYRQVKATFERAGIDVERLGGRTLRNSFAVRELKDGASIELVGEFMGHRKRKSTEHYLIDPDAPKPPLK